MDNERWFWDWDRTRRKAFIVDAEGFMIVAPTLSKTTAIEIVRQHNNAVERLSHA